jgi:peptidyl-prolyl cis-trans isomerase D
MAKGKASNFFVWVILLLLIVGLAGFGATNFGGSVQSVGRVGQTEIEINRYALEMQQEMRALAAQQGRSVSMVEAQGLGVPQAVLGRVVSQAAMEDEAAVRGLSVGDAAVREQILAIPAFQGVNGSFDREGYGFVLRSSGLTVAEFEERIRSETAANLVQSAVAAGVSVPRSLPRRFSPMRGRRAT